MARCLLLLFLLLGLFPRPSPAADEPRRSTAATIYRDTGTKTDASGYTTRTFDVLHGWIDDQGTFRVRASSVGYEVDVNTAEERFLRKAAASPNTCVVPSASLPAIGQPIRRTLRQGKEWFAVLQVKDMVE